MRCLCLVYSVSVARPKEAARQQTSPDVPWSGHLKFSFPPTGEDALHELRFLKP